MKHLKLILKTLFSNNACVEAARTKETKYSIISIVLAIVGVFLAVLPNTINNFRKNGQDWMNSSINYDLDRGIYEFSKAAKDVGIDFAISKETNGRGVLSVTPSQAKWNETFLIKKPATEGDEKHDDRCEEVHCYIYTNEYGRAFEVYVNTDLNDVDFNKYASYVLSNLNPVKKLENEKIKDEDCYLYYTMKDGKKVRVDRSTTTILFGKHNVYAYMFKPGTAGPVSSVGGDYNNYQTTNFISQCFSSEVGIKGVQNTFNNWKEFFNKVYIDTRFRSTWTSTGIMVGVDVGVILFMGLMIWILTRGKNNPFRIYSIWDGQKIAYYASFTPGLIALILGFLMSQMSMMFFVLICGVRIMWLSMRTLKPAGAMK